MILPKAHLTSHSRISGSRWVITPLWLSGSWRSFFLYSSSSTYLFLASPMEKAMATHSSTLTWRIPWTEEPGRLQSMGSLRVGHNWATSLSLFTFMHWRRKWQPTPVFLPGESQGQRSLLGAVYEVTQSRTPLMRLSSITKAGWCRCARWGQGGEESSGRSSSLWVPFPWQ